MFSVASIDRCYTLIIRYILWGMYICWLCDISSCHCEDPFIFERINDYEMCCKKKKKKGRHR